MKRVNWWTRLLRWAFRWSGLRQGLMTALLEDCAHKMLDARDVYLEYVPEHDQDKDWLRDLEQLIHRLTYIIGADQ